MSKEGDKEGPERVENPEENDKVVEGEIVGKLETDGVREAVKEEVDDLKERLDIVGEEKQMGVGVEDGQRVG